MHDTKVLPPAERGGDRCVPSACADRRAAEYASARDRLLSLPLSHIGAVPPARSRPPLGRIDLTRLTAVPPLHRPTVSGGGARHPAQHVTGGARPPAESALDLSDGTRISFAAIEEIGVLEVV